MDAGMLAQFRTCLEADLRELVHEGRNGLYSSLAEVSDTFDPKDPADMASSSCDRELMHTFRHRNLKLIEETISAIQRIDDGDFGICEECSELIDLNRLKANPTTVLCIHCKRKLETGGRRDAA